MAAENQNNTNVDVINNSIEASSAEDSISMEFYNLPTNYRHLGLAIDAGNLKMVSELLNEGACINSKIYPYRRTALHRAVVAKNKQIIIEMLKHDADWGITDMDNCSVLHLVFETKNNRWAQYNAYSRPFFSWKHQRKIIKILKIFLDLGMDVNAKMISGETPLFLAVKNRMKKVIKFLVKNGADVNVCDCNGVNLVHFLIEDEYRAVPKFYSREIEESLLQRKLPLIECLLKKFRLQRRNTNVNLLNWLLLKGVDGDKINTAGKSPLELALEHELKHMIPVLLNYSKNLLSVLECSKVILHWKFDMPEMLEPIKIIISRLLNKGFPSETALSLVIENYHAWEEDQLLNIVSVIMSKKPNMYTKNNDGSTLMHIAAQHQLTQILHIFKENEVDFNVCNFDNESPLHVYAKRETQDEFDVSLLDVFIAEGCDINAMTIQGYTPIHLASQVGNLHAVKALILKGANPNLRGERTRLTPLLEATERGHQKVIQELIDNGADINARSLCGKTALHFAVLRNDDATVEFLLMRAAEMHLRDDNRKTALDYAVQHDNLELATLLIEFGASECKDEFSIELHAPKLLDHMGMLSHIIKLSLADLEVPRCYRAREVVLHKTKHRRRKGSLTDLFIEEVKNMKIHQVYDGTTFYKYLHMTDHGRHMIKKHNYSAFYSAISASPQKFPMYNRIIQSKFQDSMRRQLLIKQAITCWLIDFNSRLPVSCIYEIITYLSNQELRIITEIRYS